MSAVDKYLQKVDQPQRGELERIRQIVKQAIPDAEEVISYGMPGFKYKKKYLMGYASFKDHMSIFPTGIPIETMKDKLTQYVLAKGTIQFTLENPIPEDVIRELVSIRIANISVSEK